MIYETLLIIGAIGMLAQAALGLGHGFAGHGHGPGGHGASQGHGHGSGGHSASSHGHGNAHGQSAHESQGHGERAQGPSPIWALLSPLAIFSLCVGAGATGLLTHTFLRGPWLGLATLVGALLFYGLLVRPIWTFAMRFASEPARALAGIVAQDAQAMGKFDARGCGMVRVILDGQVVRLLAQLEPEDRRQGVTVATGDTLTVTSVDGKTNSCRVTRL